MSKYRKWILIYVAGWAVFMILAAGAIEIRRSYLRNSPGEAGYQPAPFPTATYPDLAGRDISITDFQGSYALVNFWHTRCGYCLKTMKYFPKLLEKYSGKDFVIISYSADSEEDIRSASGKKQGPWRFLDHSYEAWRIVPMGDRQTELTRLLNVQSYPAYFIVDPSGTIIDRPANGLPAIEKVLNESGKTPVYFSKYMIEEFAFFRYGAREAAWRLAAATGGWSAIFLLLFLWKTRAGMSGR